MNIALLIAAYNRKDKTLACLESIMQQQLPPDCTLDIFLTDDASPDGTARAVKNRFPEVNLLHGTGFLFWAGGMRNSWRHAMLLRRYDHYLLLNDDTLLSENAVTVLVGCPFGGIVIGATADAKGDLSYGGRRLALSGGRPGWITWRSRPLGYAESYQPCDFGNANIMLVSAEVVDSIGILSDRYTHGLADYDYSLKAGRAGFSVRVAPGFLGACTDDHGRNWMGRRTPLRDRIAYLRSPKGLAYDEYLYFIRTHFPLSYPSALVKLWVKTLAPQLWDMFKRTA